MQRQLRECTDVQQSGKRRDAEDIAQRSVRWRRYCYGKRDGNISDGGRKTGGEIDTRLFAYGEVGVGGLRDVTQHRALTVRGYSASECQSHTLGCVARFQLDSNS
jgi:hypothetical protein